MFNRQSQLALLLLSFIAVTSTSTDAAAVCYVARNHPRASDDNPGTADAPLKTINAALPRLQPGDTVIVREGTYREQVVYTGEKLVLQGEVFGPHANGASHALPITFMARHGEEVVIKGSDVVDGWRPHKDGIWVRENWTINSQQVFVDDKPMRQIAGEMTKYLEDISKQGYFTGRLGEGIEDMIESSFYLDRDADKLYLWPPGGGDPNRSKVEVSVRPFLFFAAADYLRISGFKMRHSNTSAVVNWAAVLIKGDHCIAENLDIAWTDYAGLGVYGTHNTLIGCVSNYNGHIGMDGNGTGHRIINCTTSHNNLRDWSPSWSAGGVKFVHMWDVLVSGHLAEYNNGPGIWFDIFLAQVTVENSISRFNKGPGIFYEISERSVIRNNLCYGNTQRGIYISNSSHCAVLHNVLYGNGMSGIVVHGGVRQEGYAYGHPENRLISASDNEVRGNILMDNCRPGLCLDGWEERPELIMPDPAQPSNRGNISDNNVFWRSDGRPITFWYDWGNESFSFDEWRDRVGNDRVSIIADPKFVDPENGDFCLSPDSPAIAMARPHMALHFDITGARRDARQLGYLFSAGAYEVSSEVSEKVRQVRSGNKFWWLEDGMTLSRWWEKSGGGTASRQTNQAEMPEVNAQGIDLEKMKSGAKTDIGNIQFDLIEGLTLSSKKREIAVKIQRQAKNLYILLSIESADDSTPIQACCVVSRDDGTDEELVWELRENAVPADGDTPRIATTSRDNYSTSIVSGGDKRMLLTKWINSNPWYSVKNLRFRLPEGSEARVKILGISLAEAAVE
ncbi:MAG: right-handed parallel beta-helix repeat-containing protein [Victivallales bacterium]|nr:right-handed parallel beta-helix repeat-containing protein [Victivallales bacterium]